MAQQSVVTDVFDQGSYNIAPERYRLASTGCIGTDSIAQAANWCSGSIHIASQSATDCTEAQIVVAGRGEIKSVIGYV